MGGNAFYTVVGMMRIRLDKGSYWPGEEITATITLDFSKPVKARGLYAKLSCKEREVVEKTEYMTQDDYRRQRELGMQPSSHMKTTTREEEETLFEREVKLSGESEYSSGEYEVKFTLPADAKPTSHEFGHDKKIHVWKLRARLDIPWALDKKAEKEIFVEGL
jgi:methionine-rich copper-binding protein CopC